MIPAAVTTRSRLPSVNGRLLRDLRAEWIEAATFWASELHRLRGTEGFNERRWAAAASLQQAANKLYLIEHVEHALACDPVNRDALQQLGQMLRERAA